MKRIGILVFVLTMAVISRSSADIDVQWRNIGFVLDGGSPISGGLAQLIWISGVTAGGPAVDETLSPNGLAVGEYLLASTITDALSQFWLPTTRYDSTSTGGADPSTGSIYSRVFTTPTIIGGTTLYYETSAIVNPLAATDPPALPVVHDLNITGGAVNATSPVTAVPEPASMALFAMGALVVGLRRRKS